MARLAVADGIRVMVATPHLFRHKSADLDAINEKKVILEHFDRFRDRLAAEDIALEILPGCDVHLGVEALSLLAEDLVLTVNNGKRYLLLELPHFSIPPPWRISVPACNPWGSPPSSPTPRGSRLFRRGPKDWGGW